jgi:hypothetical protein
MDLDMTLADIQHGPLCKRSCRCRRRCDKAQAKERPSVIDAVHPVLRVNRGGTPTSEQVKGACFGAETWVAMEDGALEEIQYISVGRKVLSRNEKTGEIAYRRVTKRLVHEDVPTLDLYVRIGPGQESPIETTAEHPFWVEGRGWTNTSLIGPGATIATANGVGAVVDCVLSTGYSIDVYNIEIEEFHTYFVGAIGLWVHNKNAGSSCRVLGHY